MEVKVIDVTKDGIDKIARMGRSTRLNNIPEKWDESWGTQEKFVKSLMKIGHLGILEHITFTFHVSGISRNLTHQLVRHRLASYLQQSNRRVIPEEGDYITPPTIEDWSDKPHGSGDINAMSVYLNSINKSYKSYKKLISLDVPVEDARYCLPSGFFTHISITMNARQLLHFFELRCAKPAQWEIREMAHIMLETCYKEYPVIFEELWQEYKVEK